MSLVNVFVTYTAQYPSPLSLHNASLVSNLDKIISNTYKKLKGNLSDQYIAVLDRDASKEGVHVKGLDQHFDGY